MLLRVAMVVLTGEASTVTAASADANAVRAMANGAPLVATNRTGNTFTLSRKGYYGRMGGGGTELGADATAVAGRQHSTADDVGWPSHRLSWTQSVASSATA